MSNVKNTNKMFANNNGRFKILTDTGFSDFIGVLKTEGDFDMIEHVLDNGKSIKTTLEHKLYTSELDTIVASQVDANTQLYAEDDKIVNVLESKLHKTSAVYDVLHVLNNNRHYANSILVRNCLYIDEIAFIPAVEEFYESVFPTISSSDTTKVIITSTPLGLNFFYKMWVEAESGESAYVPYDVKWYEHPERDQKWYDTMCASMSATAIDQEMNCVSGETKVTIDGHKYTMETLYNNLNQNNGSVIAYVNDIQISVGHNENDDDIEVLNIDVSI